MNSKPRVGRRGWSASILIALVGAGCASAPPGPAVDRPPAAVPAAAQTGDLGRAAAEIALEQLGAPYRYGGAGPGGFDCSGLVQYAYRKAGKALPRTTGQLWSHTSTVTRNELRPGDLLFFSIAGKMQHVGLYVGAGRFVHAPSSVDRVALASLDSDYYRGAFLRAGRPP
jgi:cell wall-associated NlpC family hydrolase